MSERAKELVSKWSMIPYDELERNGYGELIQLIDDALVEHSQSATIENDRVREEALYWENQATTTDDHDWASACRMVAERLRLPQP